MDLSFHTYKVLGQKLLSWFDSQILVDWALDLLENGYETESLLILAGLDNTETEEREKYFWKCIKELNIDIDKKEIELIDFYVKSLTQEVLSGNVTPKFALKKMCEVVAKTDYSEKYIQFYMLDEEVEFLNDRKNIFQKKFTPGDINLKILEEFKSLK